MLDVSPTNLMEEIESAKRNTAAHLAKVKEVHDIYVGSGYSSDQSDKYEASENHPYEYLALVTPRIIYDNPKVHVKSGLPGKQHLVALAMEHGLNRWTKDTNLRNTLQEAWVHMAFAFGVMMVTQQSRPGFDPRNPSNPVWPHTYIIEPRRFFFDPLSKRYAHSRYAGHEWIRDKEDLVREAKESKGAGWNLDVIQDLPEGDGLYHTGEDQSRRQRVPNRKEVVGYEVWVPEYQLPDVPGPEDGFNGTIFTIAHSQAAGNDDGYIRDPRPFYGPRCGPYVMFGANVVPNDPFPLSPLLATFGQQRDLNSLVYAMNRASEDYKRLILVDSRSKDLATKLKNSPHDFVVPVEGLDRDAVIPIELGGITPQQLNQLQLYLDRLDRNSGINEAQRGNITGSPTATEVAVADTAGGIRLAGVQQAFADCTRRLLRNVGWYLYYDDRVVFPLGEDASVALGVPDPIFVGGDHDYESGLTYEDLELELDVYSMARTDEGVLQRNANDVLAMISQIAPIIPQTPYVDWKKLIEQIGDARNIKGLGDLIDMDLAAQLAGQEGAAFDQQQSRPRLGRLAGNTTVQRGPNNPPGPNAKIGGQSATVGEVRPKQTVGSVM